MTAADVAIEYAREQLGKPYVWGATGPNAYDCSGLVYASYLHAGVHLGRTTAQQIFNGKPVSKADLQPGDLVFPEPTHVQIYVGDGQVIESPHTGASVRQVKMWGFWQARRVAEPGTSIVGKILDSGAFGIGGLIAGKTPDEASKIAGLVKDTNIAQALSYVIKGGEELTNSEFWRRVGIALLGLLLIIAGIVFTFRKQAEQALQTGSKVAGEAAVAGAIA